MEMQIFLLIILKHAGVFYGHSQVWNIMTHFMIKAVHARS